jgi:hypothetical protein
MASTDARPVPIKNTAFRAVFPILDADGDLVTGATGLDSEVSLDQGTFADCTNEATEIATASGMYYLDLTSSEMNADCVAVIVKTSSSGAKTTVLVFYPEETGDINVDVTALGGGAQSLTDLKDFADDGYDPSTNKVQGVVLADTVTTLTGHTAQTGDAYAIVNSGTHGNAALKTLIDTIDDFLDTEIAAILAAVDTEIGAIKAKTDPMTYTVANQLDSNIQSINDTAVVGNGAGTPWGP